MLLFFRRTTKEQSSSDNTRKPGKTNHKRKPFNAKSNSKKNVNELFTFPSGKEKV
jgi:hypothetical protein